MRRVWEVGTALTLVLAAAVAAGCAGGASAAAAAAAGTKVQREPGVVHELNARNFDATVATGRWLVEFYAPWCASCRSFAPTYVAVARAIAASPRGGSVRVARVDGWTYSVLCRRFRVNAFPSFVVFQGGYVYEHTGRWSPQGLVTFALPPPLRQSNLAPSAADRDGGGSATADEGDGDGNSDGGRGATTREYAAEPAQEDVVVNGARVDRPFGPMAPHWRLATYLSAVGGELAAVGRDMSTVQLGGVVVGSGMALTVVIVVGLAVLTTPGVFKFD